MLRFQDLRENEIREYDRRYERGGTAADITPDLRIRSERQMVAVSLDNRQREQTHPLCRCYCLWKLVASEFFPTH